LFESHRVPEVTVSWQGGEPTLMGLDFFKRSVELAEQYKKPNQIITYTMQTNGTRLDDAWAAFFKEHNFLIGLSMDGPRELHNAYRVNKGGQGSFDQVMRGREFLQKHQVEFNILCTVHAANADHPLEVYRFFRDDLGAQFVQFIPIVERTTPEMLPLANKGWGKTETGQRPLYIQDGHMVTHRSVKPKQYGNFLITIFEEWVRRDVARIFVQIFDVSLDLYSCDHFVEPDYLLGNIQDTPMIELVASDQQRRFGLDKRDTLPRFCRECEVRFVCNGGCPRNRFLKTEDGEPGLNYLCAGYKLFFNHIDRPMRIMADLLRRGRAPAEIMQWYAVEDVKRAQAFASAKPNDLCPCGSGKKFKQCHGRRGAASLGS
jgi:uncharacterized protein